MIGTGGTITTLARIEGGTVDPNTVPDSLTREFKGQKVGFCCDGCPAKFMKDPDKYIKAMAADPAKYGLKGS